MLPLGERFDLYGRGGIYFADTRLREGSLRQKYDVLIYPHVGYFSRDSLHYLMRSCGFEIVAEGRSFADQFPGVVVRDMTVVGRQRLPSGKEYLRLKFRIWPNRGAPLETTLRQELEAELKRENPDYQAWMISEAYEVETRAVALVGLSWLLARAAAARDDLAERRRAG